MSECSKMIRPVLSGVVAADPETMSVATCGRFVWRLPYFLFLIRYSEKLLGSCGLRGRLLFWTLLSELAAAWRRGACRFTLLLFSALRCQSFPLPAAFALCPCLWALGRVAIRKTERVFEAAAGKGKPKGRKERKRVKPKGYELKIRLDYVYLTVVFIHQINYNILFWNNLAHVAKLKKPCKKCDFELPKSMKVACFCYLSIFVRPFRCRNFECQNHPMHKVIP